MLKSIIYFIGSLLVFFAGIIVYGIILNLKEVTLREAIEQKHLNYLSNVHIIIDRRGYRLDLYSDTILVKSYKAVFGRNNVPRKNLLDVQATPAGSYEICQIDTASKYGKYFRLNYPNYKDLTESFRAGVISEKEYETMYEELQSGICPDFKNKTITSIGIHGIGRLNFIFKNLPFTFNWTNGSVAVSNESIDEIYSVIRLGTEVVIKN